jgi:hypothetical protein
LAQLGSIPYRARAVSSAAMKIAYDFLHKREQSEERIARDPEKVCRAFITLDDRVGLVHLTHRNGQMGEFQTTLSYPHEFRKSLIRAFRQKGLRWSLLRKDGG